MLDVPSFSLVYQYYDSQLTGLCKPIVDSVSRALKSIRTSEEQILSLAMEASGEMPRQTQTRDAAEDADVFPKLTMGTALFELYLSLQQFHK